MKPSLFFSLLSLVLFLSCNDKKVSADKTINSIGVDSLTPNNTTLKESKLVGDLYITIPEELEEISEDKIKQKYPGAKRPDYVYGTEDMGVNVCYSNTNNPLKLSGLTEYLQTTTSGIASQLGNDNIAQSYMDTVNTIPFAVIEFYSPTPNEGRVYNLLFTTSLNNKMTVLSFNCLETLLPNWEQSVSEIFSSIELKNKKP